MRDSSGSSHHGDVEAMTWSGVRRYTHLLWVLAAVVAAVVLPLRPHSARSAEPPTVTIEAQRRREKELKREISHFVSSAVVTYLNNSLERWNTPVCPLVAGLPRERGEFILARVSQIATASHVRLGGEHCKPNFYVVVTPDPERLVKTWWDHDRNLLDQCERVRSGMDAVKAFLSTQQPVRVWYNSEFHSDDVALSADMVTPDLSKMFRLPPCVGGGRAGTRLNYGAVRALLSVIMVVDSRETSQLTIGQLADYLALVGLAQIRVEADTGTAPTILSLFRHRDSAPQGLSTWDQTFLYSLYNTDQSSVLQVSSIRAGMFDELRPAAATP